MNIALPYQDLTIMDACLACGVNYMDTANYEPENTDDPEWRAIYEKRCKEEGFSAYFDYSWQWAYRKKFEEAGLTALLGCGFDPGVTQAYCAYAAKHEFDSIDTIDILDCNGGDHGYAFATNFNPEINLREVSAPGSYMGGRPLGRDPGHEHQARVQLRPGRPEGYVPAAPRGDRVPGARTSPSVKRIRFFMTFGQSYLDPHEAAWRTWACSPPRPSNYNGQEIVPIQFLKALLPDPASLGPRTKGKTNIGCIFTGKKDGKEKTYYIYNVCDHQECYREVGQPGHQLHHRRARHVRRPHAADRRVDQAGRLHRRGVRPRSVPGRTGQVRPAPQREPQPGAGGLMALHDARAAVCGHRRHGAAGMFPPCQHPATCWTRQRCRNAEILGGLAERTGCRVLLAQKAFSNYDLYPLLAPALGGHRGQRPV